MGFLESISPDWLEQQYALWKRSPEQLSEQWRAFFEGFELGSAEGTESGGPAVSVEEVRKQAAVQSLIHRYREIGHLLACTDPLSPCKLDHPLLSLAAVGLDQGDLDKTFHVQGFLKESATLKEILGVLRSTYCGSIGVEFSHINDPEARQWLIDRMEPTLNRGTFTPEERSGILWKLKEAALFERTLQKKFPGQTRFSLEGGDVLVPLLAQVLRHAATLGVTDIVIGMPHRGRLNVLASIFNIPYQNIFADFADNFQHGVVGEGDVKYHKGASSVLNLPGGKVHLTLAPNPSHLEAIDPVVEGKCRARQDRIGAGADQRVMPVLIHGDAAFAGQGVVAETLNLSQLAGYRTGGTFHIVLNNQVGFTTTSAEARSTLYATDPAKMIQAPIFHVYGDDPEAVLHAGMLAASYRDRFRVDVVVEVICYRRLGHNEGDEPFFTQPLMYQSIKLRPYLHTLYETELVRDGFPPEDLQAIEAGVAECLSHSAESGPLPVQPLPHATWSEIHAGYTAAPVQTAVDAETLKGLAERAAKLPEGFHPHPKVQALLEKRRDAIVKGEGIDWGGAESLAYATLLDEGTSVRISGQDVRRGTFSHRHAAIIDQETGEPFYPLDGLASAKATFRAYDSMLAEFSVMGFDYGYSMEAPETLTIWEAQYGDFANGAQVIIDQFICCGETKWERMSGLVLFLPHGYEGQGAEHSSARIERFLNLAACDNMQLVYPTSPAQLFHMLRRQMKQPFRKPLIVFTPKSLLRHPRCVASIEQLSTGSFQPVIADSQERSAVDSVLICTGKVYYDLLERRERDGIEGTALVRIEQLYPFPEQQLAEALKGYPDATRFRWVQEEPYNMGAWKFMRSKLARILGGEPRYVGRAEAASPASGSHRQDRAEQDRLVAEAFLKH
ncbi:2-oxoglutarate dehydrogenase E1 component [Geomesophilobacter sediminis]|uniref:oxoglutarate dehydrogenase (succinyl-transferring) n=1 Tax=Geomesophilobacter sediminis TaxID=2798584 RepID=A0A8J7S8J6_9BACT|nr:2-oxoglutarate dehydrogenase E1 component [Geomesophilobacter sediminis]MBJ6726516.1 2-oxoglutarate dehydrogenase E1 component [Geomesophilobacter sediminis]